MHLFPTVRFVDRDGPARDHLLLPSRRSEVERRFLCRAPGTATRCCFPCKRARSARSRLAAESAATDVPGYRFDLLTGAPATLPGATKESRCGRPSEGPARLVSSKACADAAAGRDDRSPRMRSSVLLEPGYSFARRAIVSRGSPRAIAPVFGAGRPSGRRCALARGLPARAHSCGRLAFLPS
jgi:hypothetical protein